MKRRLDLKSLESSLLVSIAFLTETSNHRSNTWRSSLAGYIFYLYSFMICWEIFAHSSSGWTTRGMFVFIFLPFVLALMLLTILLRLVIISWNIVSISQLFYYSFFFILYTHTYASFLDLYFSNESLRPSLCLIISKANLITVQISLAIQINLVPEFGSIINLLVE